MLIRHVVKDGLDWTGKSRTEFVKHGLDWTGLDWTGKTRTESVFYKSRTEICKRWTRSRSKILSILMIKFNVFTEKVQCFLCLLMIMIIWWFQTA